MLHQRAALPCEGRSCAGTHLRRGSLTCVHSAGGPPPPTASERAMGSGGGTPWPMQGRASASSASLGNSMAKAPAGRGEKDSDGASPTDEQPPGEGMDGMGRDLKAVTTLLRTHSKRQSPRFIYLAPRANLLDEI